MSGPAWTFLSAQRPEPEPQAGSHNERFILREWRRRPAGREMGAVSWILPKPLPALQKHQCKRGPLDQRLLESHEHREEGLCRASQMSWREAPGHFLFLPSLYFKKTENPKTEL